MKDNTLLLVGIGVVAILAVVALVYGFGYLGSETQVYDEGTLATDSDAMDNRGGEMTTAVDEGYASSEKGRVGEMANSQNPVAVVETNVGTFRMELYEKRAPITVGNFVKLVEEGYYDGLIFHRIIDGFMVQGGDPNCVSGDGPCGSGGPGWSIPLEIVEELKHSEAGMLAMARSQDPDSAGSQFYIILAKQDFLDGNYAVFGKVIEGLDVVLEIGVVETDAQDKPIENVVMERVYLEE